MKPHREIMAAHWSNEMITLFTAVVYLRDHQGDLQFKSFAVVSDELSQDKSSVYSFNSAILTEVKKETKTRFTIGVIVRPPSSRTDTISPVFYFIRKTLEVKPVGAFLKQHMARDLVMELEKR